MSTATDEDTRLDVDLDRMPPCEINVIMYNTKIKCGRPAVARVKFHCTVCNLTKISFVCKQDFEELKQRLIRCDVCGCADASWLEI